MQRMFLKVLAIALFANLAAYGQSLGDVARENREKQNAAEASGTKPKVITNQDLPQDPQANSRSHEAQPAPATAASSRAADYRAAEQLRAEQRATEQWKRQILGQENKIASLRARIDQINRWIHPAGGTVQYVGPYNRYQARQLERVAELQQQLDEQTRKLDAMQEEARHAGMHTSVYDP